MTPDFSLIIPVWNEQHKIENDVRSVMAFFKRIGLQGEIIVSDDGSTDGTHAVLTRLQKEFAGQLNILLRRRHSGKGHAVRGGILQSRGSIVAFMDSGGNVPLSFLQKGSQKILNGQCQIAAGSRFLPESRIVLPMPLRRQMTSFLFRKIVHWYLKLPAEISDPQCGFKIFEGSVARQLAQRATIDGFLFDLEFYFLAGKQGWQWREFPIHWKCDRDSRLSISKNFLSILKDLKYLHDTFI